MHKTYSLPFLFLCLTFLLAGCAIQEIPQTHIREKKSYTIKGKTYYPLKSAVGFREKGTASWYGNEFHGKPTASGELYDQNKMTCAHKILPLGTPVRVTNLENRRSVILKVNDRGPFVSNRIIDLSRAAAKELQIIGRGTGTVLVEYAGSTAKPITQSGAYYIQVGAFANRENAERLTRNLSQRGLFGRTLYGSNGLWNVQAGPWEENPSAIDRRITTFRKEFPGAFLVAK